MLQLLLDDLPVARRALEGLEPLRRAPGGWYTVPLPPRGG